MPTMASRVSTSSLVCELFGVSLRSRNMYFADWLVELISFATARLTRSPGAWAGISSAVLHVAAASAIAENRSHEALRDGISLIRVCALPPSLDEKRHPDVV